MSLKGKVAVVTGGGSGIGRACAIQLARDGATVAVWDLNGEAAAGTVKLIEGEGNKAKAYVGDAAAKESIDGILARIRAELGPVLVLVNNAGITGSVPFLDITPEAMERMYRINLMGPFLLTQAAIPDMLKAGWGRVVNISSSSAQTGSKGMTHYSSSKGGIVALTKSLALEFADKGITVNNIPPGFIDTPMLRSSPVNVDNVSATSPMKRPGRPEDIAAGCSFLASEAAAYISGQTLGVNGARVTSAF
ncbi:MAG: SDR family NAD(P)-dependent oxidoreductase [Solimonas sp.]